MILIEMFGYPFMQRAFAAGAILALLLAALGIFMTLRKMSFFGDGIAHASLAGIAIAVLAGWAPLPVALIWTVIVAIGIYWLERSTKLPSDTLIGILFTASMSFGIILFSFTRGYQPELMTYLFGSILAVKTIDLITIAAISIVILAWLFASLRTLTYMSLSEESAAVSGEPVRFQTAALYVALALATVAAVKVLGIILVSALLILPSATSRMLTHDFRGHLIFSLIIAELVVGAGLIFSFLFDLPSGATIVIVGTIIFFLAALFRKK
jgi:zinc transport system permease protein